MGIMNVVQVVLLGHDANMDARRALGITIASYLASEKGEVSDRAITVRVLCTVYDPTSPDSHPTNDHAQGIDIAFFFLPRPCRSQHPRGNQYHAAIPYAYPQQLSNKCVLSLSHWYLHLCTKEACPNHLALYPNLCVPPY